MKTAPTANHACAFTHHSAVHSPGGTLLRPDKVEMQPDMNLMLFLRAEDKDGPARIAPLKLDFRSRYVRIGTFDRFLKIEEGCCKI